MTIYSNANPPAEGWKDETDYSKGDVAPNLWVKHYGWLRVVLKSYQHTGMEGWLLDSPTATCCVANHRLMAPTIEEAVLEADMFIRKRIRDLAASVE